MAGVGVLALAFLLVDSSVVYYLRRLLSSSMRDALKYILLLFIPLESFLII